MSSIGIYGYTFFDWKEIDYPLDLWLEHCSSLFNQVAILTWGVDKLPFNAPNIRHTNLYFDRKIKPDFHTNSWIDEVNSKLEALHLLSSTDWKIMLEIDEFPNNKPSLDLNPNLVYAIKYRQLYGNANSEIINNGFPSIQWRIHFNYNVFFDPDASNVMGSRGPDVMEVWHTGACRNPVSLSKKWKKQIELEIQHGYNFNSFRLKDLNGPFPYKEYKKIWPNSQVIRVKDEELPEIIRRSKDRFHWVDFSEES